MVTTNNNPHFAARLFMLFLICLICPCKTHSGPPIRIYAEKKDASASWIDVFKSVKSPQEGISLFSFVISAGPAPSSSVNNLQDGMAVLVVPENATVAYDQIEVSGSEELNGKRSFSINPDLNDRDVLWQTVKTASSYFGVFGNLLLTNGIHDFTSMENIHDIDLNQFDLVQVAWNSPRMKNVCRVQIDITVQMRDEQKIGLLAYWKTAVRDSNGLISFCENSVDPGFNLPDIVHFYPRQLM